MTYTPTQDLNHNHHKDPAHRYACHNKQPSTPMRYRVQDGWTREGQRIMRPHATQWLDIGCGHSYRTTDPACSGCHWRGEP